MPTFKRFVTHYLSKFLIVLGFVLISSSYYQFALAEFNYYYTLFLGRYFVLEIPEVNRNTELLDQTFSNISPENLIKIEPVNKDFSIVIEKLNINAPIVKDVSVINEKEYMESLKMGVAHASFSGYPGDLDSNVYLFAHSAYNFWELGRYSSVFNQLHKLNVKDRVTIFYQGKKYVYEVDNMLLFKDFQVTDAVFQTIGPTLTLQTCYPPGTTLNRLVVRASLIGIY